MSQNKGSVYVYTAVFEPDDGAITASFPDLPDVNTYGNTIEEAIQMAQEALFAWLDMAEEDGDTIPEPTKPNEVKTPVGGFTSAILVDLNMRVKYNNKAIKKTLTIPEWLNNEAEKKGINFSRTLQKALKEELGIEHQSHTANITKTTSNHTSPK